MAVLAPHGLGLDLIHDLGADFKVVPAEDVNNISAIREMGDGVGAHIGVAAFQVGQNGDIRVFSNPAPVGGRFVRQPLHELFRPAPHFAQGGGHGIGRGAEFVHAIAEDSRNNDAQGFQLGKAPHGGKRPIGFFIRRCLTGPGDTADLRSYQGVNSAGGDQDGRGHQQHPDQKAFGDPF